MNVIYCDDVYGEYDYGFFGLGYESRCLSAFQIKELKFKKVFAFGYTYSNNVFQYQNNKSFFSHIGAEIFELGNEDVLDRFSDILDAIKHEGKVKVFIDVSVMTRQRLSMLIWLMCEELATSSEIMVYYRIARYVEPPIDNCPVCAIGPIIPNIISIKTPISKPLAVIAGLGYERDKALGAIGSIDAQDVFFMIPVSENKKFEKKVYDNNKLLLSTYSKNQTTTYEVSKPYSTYVELSSLVMGLKDDYRILLLPLGPKMLTVISILLAFENPHEINVWRVSSEEKEPPLNRESSDSFSVLKIIV